MNFLKGLAFVGSLCLIGSDGSWFPVANFIGLLIFCVTVRCWLRSL